MYQRLFAGVVQAGARWALDGIVGFFGFLFAQFLWYILNPQLPLVQATILGLLLTYSCKVLCMRLLHPWQQAFRVSFFVLVLIVLVLVLFVDFPGLVEFWHQPNVFEKPIQQWMASYRTAAAQKIIKCPKHRLGAKFLERPEVQELTAFMLQPGNEMMVLRGLSDTGKTTALKQAICEAHIQHTAIFVSFRTDETRASVKTFRQVAEAFEDAVAHLGVPRRQNRDSGDGETRLRAVLADIERYQAVVEHSAVVLDDLHALKFIPNRDDRALALNLVKETMIQLAKEYGTAVVYASSDGIFVDELQRLLAGRITYGTMRDLPVDACTKRIPEPFKGQAEEAIKRIGSSVATCVALSKNPTDIESRENEINAKTLHEFTALDSKVQEVICRARGSAKITRNDWLSLREVNKAELDPLNSKPRLVSRFKSPVLRSECLVLLSEGNLQKELPSTDDETRDL